MMSGRGLGHTGGTLDKLEVDPRLPHRPLARRAARRAIATIGCALIGQTAEIAPADRRLYALRDVTGTVESIPLISASIMSKKIAEGIGGLVLDVKTGSGAFMKTLDDSRALARVARRDRRRVRRAHRGADHRDGRAARHAWSATRSKSSSRIEMLKGRGPEDLEELSVLLAARMLVVGRRRAGRGAGASARVRDGASRRGAGLEVFRAHRREPGRRSARARRLLAAAARARRAPRHGAPRDGYVAASRPKRSAAPPWPSAPDAPRWTTSSIPASASSRRAGRHARSARATPSCSSAIAAAAAWPTRRQLLDAAVRIADGAAVPRPLVVERVTGGAMTTAETDAHAPPPARAPFDARDLAVLGVLARGGASSLRRSIGVPRAAAARRADRRFIADRLRRFDATAGRSTGARSAWGMALQIVLRAARS